MPHLGGDMLEQDFLELVAGKVRVPQPFRIIPVPGESRAAYFHFILLREIHDVIGVGEVVLSPLFG